MILLSLPKQSTEIIDVSITPKLYSAGGGDPGLHVRPSDISVAVVKCPDKSNVGEEGLIPAYSYRFLSIKAEWSGQELKQLVISYPWSSAEGS